MLFTQKAATSCHVNLQEQIAALTLPDKNDEMTESMKLYPT